MLAGGEISLRPKPDAARPPVQQGSTQRLRRESVGRLGEIRHLHCSVTSTMRNAVCPFWLPSPSPLPCAPLPPVLPPSVSTARCRLRSLRPVRISQTAEVPKTAVPGLYLPPFAIRCSTSITSRSSTTQNIGARRSVTPLVSLHLGPSGAPAGRVSRPLSAHHDTTRKPATALFVLCFLLGAQAARAAPALQLYPSQVSLRTVRGTSSQQVCPRGTRMSQRKGVFACSLFHL